MGFVLWIAAILSLSGQDGEEAFGLTYKLSVPIADILYEEPTLSQIEDVMLVLRQVGRVGMFLVLGMLTTLAVDAIWQKINEVNRLYIIYGFLIFFSIFDEVHKLLIPGRHCTVEEILVNIMSSFIGCVCMNLLYKICKRKKAIL